MKYQNIPFGAFHDEGFAAVLNLINKPKSVLSQCRMYSMEIDEIEERLAEREEERAMRNFNTIPDYEKYD